MNRSRRPGFAPLLSLPLLALASACGSTTVTTNQETVVGGGTETTPSETASSVPLGQLPEGVTPTRYQLALTIVPEQERFSGEVAIDVQLAESQSTIWIHGRDLTVSTATVTPEGGEAITAQWEQLDDEGVVALRLERPVGPGAATIRVSYDAAFDTTLNGLYRVEAGGDAYAFTQFEAISARKAFPSFDEPRFKTPFDVSLTVKADHEAICSSREVDSEARGDDMKQVRFATTEPIPTYLLAIAVGPLDVVEAPPLAANSVRTRPIPFRGVAVRGAGERLAYALEHTPAMVTWLEEYFGVEYPYDKLDIVAVPDFNSGAMENVGLITFREYLLLLDEDNATEGQKRSFAYVMAHELAHQWFGNLVTMPWWDDIWLNESFATWMGNKVVRELYPTYEADVSMVSWVQGAMRSDSLTTARQIRQPIESSHDIRNAFDRITYQKGGGVLEMFERFVTPEVFQRAMQIHMARHRFGTATADDLLASLSEAAGTDVATPARTFLYQPGVPYLAFEQTCPDDGAGHLTVNQSRYFPVGSPGDANLTWNLPVCVRYPSGGETRVQCELISGSRAQIDFEGDSCPAWVMPNADASGYFRFTLDDDALTALRTTGWRQLNVREKLALADSLEAAFDAGTVQSAQLFPMMEPMVRETARPIAEAPMGPIQFIQNYVADDATRPRVTAYAARTYNALYRRLGTRVRGNEGPETRILRGSVLDFMVHTAEDPRARRDAARLGREYVGFGGDGELHEDRVDSNMASAVLSAAVVEGDAEFFDHVLNLMVASDDAALRGRLLQALAHTTDEALSARVRALALDERLRANEAMTPLWVQARQTETAAATWAWLQQNFDALGERMPEGRMGSTPWMTTGLCSEAGAAEVRAFYASRIEAIPGGPRNLAGALEAIELCVARVAAHRENAMAHFE